MNLRFLLIAILIILIAAEDEIVDEGSVKPYRDLKVDLSNGTQNCELHPLRDLEVYLRQQFSKKEYFRSREVGEIVRIDLQVQSGLNYRFTFQNNAGQKLQATVHEQPWDKSRKLTHINFQPSEQL